MNPNSGSASRRKFLATSTGLLGMGVAEWMSARAVSAASIPNQKPRSTIVLFAWGGLSHLDTLDLKPNAGSDVRSIFQPISTSVPGIQMGEHLPRLSQIAHELAIVRSVHHGSADHRMAAYWNITGHAPAVNTPAAVPPSRKDWPCLGSMVEYAELHRSELHGSEKQAGIDHASRLLPRHINVPYPIADRGLVNGQYGGFLGTRFDPVFVRPPGGTVYEGVSPNTGHIDLTPPPNVDLARQQLRTGFLNHVEQVSLPVGRPDDEQIADVLRTRTKALELMSSPVVKDAFDLDQESPQLHDRYGRHICGQSTLLARRLTEAGVPLVTVNCAAGDLNGSAGAHFDTHGNNFNRLKDQMLPPLDQAMSALITDLRERGTLDETLVVLMTEFGRTPKINGGAGRDHFPNCYSTVFAGGGIRGGQMYGESDATGSLPLHQACTPADLHATIFRSMGIDPGLIMHDLDDRPLPLCDGTALPLFG